MGISVCVCRTVSVGAERGECVYKCAGWGRASHTYLGPGMYVEVCVCVVLEEWRGVSEAGVGLRQGVKAWRGLSLAL